MHAKSSLLVWVGILILATIPVAAAAFSPLLEWRQPVYIVAGFAGIVAMTLLLFQPLLAVGLISGISRRQRQRVHRWLGITLIALVSLHVVGLWLTSPPDVIDALLFRSPTPFSLWGVIAMWAVFVSGCLFAARRRIPLTPQNWRVTHRVLAVIIVLGSSLHALLIDGTMENISKWVLSIAVVIIMLAALIRLNRRV